MNEQPQNVQQFMQSNENVRMQEIYLQLINYRGGKISDTKHKRDVMVGYYKLHNFFNRGVSIAEHKLK